MTLSVHRTSLCENRLCFLFLLLLTLTTNSIYAEGTKELSPSASDRVFLYLNGDLYNNFGRYDGSTDQRLFFHVANPNQEQVYLGFSQAVSSGHYPCAGGPITSYFRIKDPNGNIVFPTPGNPFGQILNQSTANIGSREEAISGPAPLVGEDGYQPIVFDPAGLPAGDYYVEFSTVANAPNPGSITAIEHWDITVATKETTPAAKPGRVFATNWSFYTPSISCGLDADFTWFDRPFNGSIHVLSREGFVNKVNFQDAGFQPAAFNLYFNETGTSNTGDLFVDRQSFVGLGSSLALQRIFLNDPDITVYPTGEYGALNTVPELHICAPNSNACILVETTKEGQIEILIDLEKESENNEDFIFTPNTKDVLILFNIEAAANEVPPYTRCIPWDRLDGLGTRVSAEANFDLSVTYQQGVYHLPFFDVEYLLNGITTTNIRPLKASGNTADILYYDDSNIPSSPTNGSPQTALNGCETPCHTWVNSNFGNQNTINTWFFADEETKLKNEESQCLITAINDTVTTSFETEIIISVLNNDIGNVLDTSSVAISVPPNQGGTLSTGEDGIISYIPNNGFIGIDSFQYLVCYDYLPVNSLCDLATVYVSVGNETEVNCTDGVDDDNDGLIDCDDLDCLPIAPNAIQRNGEKE